MAARALLVGVCDVDLDATARQMRRQRAAPRRLATQMPAHRCVARVHFNGLGHRARFIGELLERQLQLPSILALGLFTKQALAQDVELMPQRGDFALRFRELVLNRGKILSNSCRWPFSQ